VRPPARPHHRSQVLVSILLLGVCETAAAPEFDLSAGAIVSVPCLGCAAGASFNALRLLATTISPGILQARVNSGPISLHINGRAVTVRYGFRNSSGSLAALRSVRRASSRVSRIVAQPATGRTIRPSREGVAAVQRINLLRVLMQPHPVRVKLCY